MYVLKCERHPQLQVNTHAGKVRFTDGQAEATGDQADAVEDVAEEYGIELAEALAEESAGGGGEGSGSGPDAAHRPARSASKADWMVYAVAQGMDAEAAKKATRDELAARYVDGGSD